MPIGALYLFVLGFSQFPEKKLDVTVQGERPTDVGDTVMESHAQTNVKILPTENTSEQSVKVLETVPSAFVTQTGGQSGPASVSLFGAPGHSTLLVSDGILLNDPSHPSGGADFSLFYLDPLSEVIVVPGPASVLFRNGGLGGVVDVRTRSLTKPVTLSGQVEAGFGLSKKLRAAGGYANESQQVVVSAGVFEHGGMSTASKWRGNSEFDTQVAETGRIFYSHKLSPRLNVDASLRFLKQDADIDAFDGDDENYTVDTKTFSSHARLRGLVTESYRQTLALSFSNTNRISDDKPDAAHIDTFARYEYKGQNQSIDWLHEIAFDDVYTIKSGVGSARDLMTLKERSNFAPVELNFEKSRQPIWLYAELEHVSENGPAGRLGARIESVKNEMTRSISAFESIPTSESFRFELSLGYNERLPSLYQLYADSIGNEDLKTENSVAGVLGLVSRYRDSTTALQVFVTEFRNLVEFEETGFRNVGRAETYGFNFENKIKSAVSTTTFQYGYLKARDLEQQRPLNLRPRHRVNVTIASDESLTLGVYFKLRYNSEQSDVGGAQTLPSLYLWEMGSHWWLTENINLYGRFENLSNVRYETSYGYAGEPRTFYLGATAKL